MNYVLTVGLEIHAELKTKSKMFCACANNPDEEKPNVNICPVCMAHPGTLPVINKQAVAHVLKLGTVCGGTIADFTEFDRKNYFYPDIPKGYQISQYKYPLVSGGSLGGVALTRIHLEEDTATSIHEGDHSLVNFNRAGLPLMELVTEPVIHSAAEAAAFAKELQLMLRYLGAGEANMEKGEMRVEANISVAPEGSDKLGTKVEVKNLNSFKSVEKAIEYEMNRHISLIEAGQPIVQETRGFNEDTNATFSQRKKEDSHDYRYFPDPDLPKIHISQIPEFSASALSASLPELPHAKRLRYSTDFGLSSDQIEVFIYNFELTALFERGREALAASGKGDLAKLTILLANYITSDLVSLLKNSDAKAPEPAMLAELVQMIGEDLLSSRGAKDTLAIMAIKGGNPRDIAEQEGLIQKSNKEELLKTVQEIIAANEGVVAEYKAGKAASLQFLIGQGMKATKGSANPAVLKELFESSLS